MDKKTISWAKNNRLGEKLISGELNRIELNAADGSTFVLHRYGITDGYGDRTPFDDEMSLSVFLSKGGWRKVKGTVTLLRYQDDKAAFAVRCPTRKGSVPKKRVSKRKGSPKAPPAPSPPRSSSAGMSLQEAGAKLDVLRSEIMSLEADLEKKKAELREAAAVLQKALDSI